MPGPLSDPFPDLPRHGGDLGQAARLFPRARRPWVDLSTGVNPWPYPIGEIDPALWTRLPGQGAMDAVIAAARVAYGAEPALAGVVAGPGSEVLLTQIPRLLPAGRVAVLAPTYGDHAVAWRAAGHIVELVADPLVAETPYLVLCQPNNPDGRRHDPAVLLDLAARQAGRGGLLVVDEAFADASPHDSVAFAAGRPGLLVLRSFGKFYGLAGLRLGFALGEPAATGCLAAALGAWAVSGPALEVGRRALADAAWRDAMRVRLAHAANDLDGVLRAGGLEVVGGTDLFRLAAHPRAVDLWRHLARAGLWVRPFAYNPGWLRFGLPADANAAARLVAALADFNSGNARG